MRFHHHDALRLFTITADCGSFAAAAKQLNQTKGAISYQIRILERDLGFSLFDRTSRGVTLSAQGSELLDVAKLAFQSIDQKIHTLRRPENPTLTIGMSTYFASRWLSPRLMMFMKFHPEINLRIQPLVHMENLSFDDVDVAIRWGQGQWKDVHTRALFPCPAFATATPEIAHQIAEKGLEHVLPTMTLLEDTDGSIAWKLWLQGVGQAYIEPQKRLTIPDPNVRVQAAVDGQGIVLNDALVADELAAGKLARISPIQLNTYGYFLTRPTSKKATPAVTAFEEWI